jgi:AcrR family transcriptional regulator
MTSPVSLAPAPTRRRNPPGAGARLREDIMNATMGLLASGASPATLSLRSVARAAHVTAPAIYAHFSGMDDLLAAVVTRRFADFTALLDGAVNALPPTHTAQDELIARVTAYCQFGLERPGDYELLFGRGEAYGGVPYENSAGQQAFTDLVTSVTAVRPDADGFGIAAVLWPAMHGLVCARRELAGFPWPPLTDQIRRVIDGLVVGAVPAQPQAQDPVR